MHLATAVIHFLIQLIHNAGHADRRLNPSSEVGPKRVSCGGVQSSILDHLRHVKCRRLYCHLTMPSFSLRLCHATVILLENYGKLRTYVCPRPKIAKPH